jgi:hypothetical protein
VREGDQAGRASRGRGSSGASRFLTGIRRGWYLRSAWPFRRSWNCINRGAGIGLFFNAHQALIGDFPAKVLVLAALLEILFQENGPARVRYKHAGSGQQDITGAVLHHHTTTQKG